MIEDINPCDREYWDTKVFKYIVGLLHYDLISGYDSMPQRAKDNVLSIHRHLSQCQGCSESLTMVLSKIATNESIASKAGEEQVPPEAFGRLRKNREYLDGVVEVENREENK